MKLSRAVFVALSLASSAASAQPRPRPQSAQPANAQPANAQPAAQATQPSPEIEAEHARGIELRRQQHDAEARDVFRGIYERTHEPRALARQAAAEGAMGEWVAAEEHLTAALESTTDAWITQNRAGLESDLANIRSHVGLLEVITSTPHAELWVGGARLAALPLEHPLHVRAGTIAVEVRADGYLSEVRPVTITGGVRAVARETVNLTPDVRREASPVRPPVAPPAAPVTGPGETDRGGVPALRVVGLSLIGAGAVGIGVGVAGMVRYSSDVSDFNADPACGTAALTDACRALYDSGTSARTLGIVGFAVGGAVLAGGLTAMLLSLRRASPETPALTVNAHSQGFGVSLAGSF